MRLESVAIKNFRCYREEAAVRISDLTTFVGKNDIGKSSVLEALEIFFNNDAVKIEQGDANVYSGDPKVSITCEFSDLPTTLSLDAGAKTTLADEYLLTSEGTLKILKVYDCKAKTPSVEVFLIAHHPTAEGVSGLLELKEKERILAEREAAMMQSLLSQQEALIREKELMLQAEREKLFAEIKHREEERKKIEQMTLQAQQEAEKRKLESLMEELRKAVDKSQALEPYKDQLLLDITPEGVRIQIVDAQNRPMFDVGSARLRDYTVAILRELAKYLATVENRISLTGHTDIRPYPGSGGYSNWELSADRANAARRALIVGGLPDDKIARVVGLASSVLFDKTHPDNPINRRISIVVMTKQAEEEALKTDTAAAAPTATADPATAAPALGPSGAAPTSATPVTLAPPGT